MGIAVGVVCVLSFLNATGNLLPRSDTEEPSPPAGPDSSGRAGRKLPTAVLFGDSITQEGSDPAMQGWVSALTAYWVRRVDVVNRGFGGYTSRWGLQLFDSVVLARRPEVIFLFFGANDAVVPAHVRACRSSSPQVYIVHYACLSVLAHCSWHFFLHSLTSPYPHIPS